MHHPARFVAGALRALFRWVVELAVVKLRIKSALCHQAIVRALLHNVATLHAEDEIRIADGGEPVRNDEASAPFHQGVHRLLNEQLCTGIDGAGGLVKDQHFRVGEDGARDG